MKQTKQGMLDWRKLLTLFCLFHMSFCVSSDSRKFLVTFAMVSAGNVNRLSFRIVVSSVALIGKPNLCAGI